MPPVFRQCADAPIQLRNRPELGGCRAGLTRRIAWIDVGAPNLGPDALRRIRARYEQVRPTALADAFFRHLFAAMPGIRTLLPDDLVTHGEYVEAAISVVIRNLADLDVLAPALEALGAEHARRGIDAGQLVGAHPVLMATIREASAERWTVSDERDWSIAFSALLAPMVRGAAAEAKARKSVRLPGPAARESV